MLTIKMIGINRNPSGFTLIELAIVIAILGILAAVAWMNMSDTQATAECVLIKGLRGQLQSTYATFAAAEGETPKNFDQYVTATLMTLPAPSGPVGNRTHYLLSLINFGTNSTKSPPVQCAVSNLSITCDGVFSYYPNNVSYQFNNGAVLINNENPIASTRTGVKDCQ